MSTDYIQLNAQAEIAAENIQHQINAQLDSMPALKETLAGTAHHFVHEFGGAVSGHTVQHAAAPVCHTLGNTVGVAVGATAGAGIGLFFPPAELPATIAGAYIGRVAVSSGCNLAASVLGHMAWGKAYQDRADERLSQAKTELSSNFEHMHTQSLSELTANKDPVSQAYIKDQYYRAIKQQPFYNMLNEKTKNTIKIDQSRQRMNLATKDASFEAVNKYHDNLDLVTEKYTKRISTILSNSDETSAPPSPEMIAENRAFLKEMQAENAELTHQNHIKLNAVLHEQKRHTEELKKLHESIKAQDKRHQDQLDKEQALAEYRGMEAGFNVISQIGAMTGNETLGKIGTIGAAGVSIAFNSAMIAGTIPGMAAVTGWGLMVPYAGIALAGLSIISALCSKKKKKDDSMMNAIRALSEQIDQVRAQMHQRFDALDKKLDAHHQDIDNKLKVLNNVLKTIISDGFSSLEMQISTIQEDLNRLGDLLVKGLGAQYLQEFVGITDEIDRYCLVDGSRDNKIESRLIKLMKWLTNTAVLRDINGTWALPDNLTEETAFNAVNLRSHDKLLGNELSHRLGYIAHLIALVPGVDLNDVRIDDLPNVAHFTQGVNSYAKGRLHVGTMASQITDPKNVSINSIQGNAENALLFMKKLNAQEEVILTHIVNLYKANYEQLILSIQQSATARLNTGTVPGFEFPKQDKITSTIPWPTEVTCEGLPSLPFSPVLMAIQNAGNPQIQQLIQNALKTRVGSIKALYTPTNHPARRDYQEFDDWKGNHIRTSRGVTYQVTVLYDLNGIQHTLLTTSGLSGHVQYQTGTIRSKGGHAHYRIAQQFDDYVAKQNDEAYGDFLLRAWPTAALNVATDYSSHAIPDNLKSEIIKGVVENCITASPSVHTAERAAILKEVTDHKGMLGDLPQSITLLKAMLIRLGSLLKTSVTANINALWDEKKLIDNINDYQMLVSDILSLKNAISTIPETVDRRVHPIISHLNYCSQLLEALKQHESVTAHQNLAEIAEELQVDEAIVIDSKRILCDFEKGTRLGVGSFGQVYKGIDAITRGNVAIKVFFTGASLQKDARGELDVTARLSQESAPSPHLVQIMGVTRLADHRMALVMEYVDNSTLWDHLHEKPEKISWENAMSVSGQIIEGIAYLHQRGITHGDFKSANILLTSDFQVKICDYGLAKVACSTRAVGSTRLTSTNTHVGTQAYRAPELFKDKKARSNPRTDMYSLSIVIYEMITRLKPFHDTDGDDMTILPLLLAHMNGLSQDDPFEIPALEADASDAQKNFRELFLPIFNECRNMNPQARPSAAALSERLRLN